jgi:hypothetical protein
MENSSLLPGLGMHLSEADLLGMILRRDAYMIGEGFQKVKYFKIVAILIAVGESLIFSFEIHSILYI